MDIIFIVPEISSKIVGLLKQPTSEWVMTQAKKSIKERFLHAFLFEILAIGLCAPVAAWAMGKSLFEMGVLTAVIAWIALLWNMIYNAGFDRLENRLGITRNLRVRVIHAFGFELGLILIVIPLAAWWLSISLWQAFVLDIGLVLFLSLIHI